MKNNEERCAKIAVRNNEFRRTFFGGKIRLSPGVRAIRDQKSLSPLYQLIKTDDPSEYASRPLATNCLGIVQWEGLFFRWDIELTDLSGRYLSPEPANPDVTLRTLQISLADEK